MRPKRAFLFVHTYLTPLIVLWIFPVIASPVFAQDAVDLLLQSRMKESNIAGVVVRIEKHGVVQKEKAYGLASLELQVPLTTDNVFEIASAGKSVTALLIGRMIDEQKIGLSDTVGKYLPDVPEPWRPVTIYQLLTHTSGLPDLAVRPGRDELIAYDRNAAWVKLRQIPMTFTPGAKWSYNQTNYFLVLCILEKIESKQFPDIMRAEVFTPLRMEHTSFGNSRDVVPGRVTSYERDVSRQWKVRQTTFPEFTFGAAGVNTTVTDWSRWFNAALNGRIVRKATFDQMTVPAKLSDGSAVSIAPGVSYGMGFAVFDRGGRRSVGHSGGGTAAFRYFPEQDTVIYLLLNSAGNADALLDAIADAHFSGAMNR